LRITLVEAAAAAGIAIDALAVPVAAGRPLAGTAAELDRAMGGLLAELIGGGEFKGCRFRPRGVSPRDA
jgi:hypothetical protein